MKKRDQTYSGEHRIKERPASCHIARQPHSPSHQAIRQIYSRWSNGDAGLTGRKIIIDTYGCWGAHGDGAFSGKDPTKVNQSAAYICHQMAKSVVTSGLDARCLVQLTYANRVRLPTKCYRSVAGAAKPKYHEAAAYSHFGRQPDTENGIKFFKWKNASRRRELLPQSAVSAVASVKQLNHRTSASSCSQMPSTTQQETAAYCHYGRQPEIRNSIKLFKRANPGYQQP